MPRRLPRSLYSVIGYDAGWRKEFTAKTCEGLLTNPVPAPLPVEDAALDERLLTAAPNAAGDPLN